MIKRFKAECAEIVFLPSINFWSHNVQQEHLRYSNSLYPAVKQNRCNCFNLKTVNSTVGGSSPAEPYSILSNYQALVSRQDNTPPTEYLFLALKIWELNSRSMKRC